MSELWVDTDFGFDDLWALLLLRHLGVYVAGISLVAGNTPLPQVIANALGAQQAYDFDASLFAGADRPLARERETAERILGPRGMLSRGQHLPEVTAMQDLPDAAEGLQTWLRSAGENDRRDILAIGPLTNIAGLVRAAPELAQKITRLVWMGGSSGPGNHSPQAEFNALADPEAAALVSQAGLPLDVIDLMLCRKVHFGPDDLPLTDGLTSDLLGGYLDIALCRARPRMLIYDPVAALAIGKPQVFEFLQCSMTVSVTPDETYGKSTFTQFNNGTTRLAVGTTTNVAQICLNALTMEHAHDD
ncbi:nucleoside hydrolase [uncultured Ruegeria sp.]|uniref:nucleoside hydrolase n=1 Tax=uncultured Ruegeria sp. TaxID=259304 RepID=UPI00261E0A93|nr:nucleoside hydrolase [uncultured Ruegeria sp.]